MMNPITPPPLKRGDSVLLESTLYITVFIKATMRHFTLKNTSNVSYIPVHVYLIAIFFNTFYP